MGKNQVLFLSQMEESKMAKQVHIRVDDDIYKELSDYSVVSGQSMQDCLSVAIRQMLVKAKEEPSQDCNGYTSGMPQPVSETRSRSFSNS